jgi:hypothetical protein
MIGNGKNGIETEISTTVLRGLHQLFNQFHVAPNNQDYVLGTDTNAFRIADYSQWDRSGDSGADPWDVVLICFALVALIISVSRGDRKPRMALLLAVGLTLGYLLFAGISRWNVFAVRYEIPQFVAWSPIIAVALSTLPKMVVRLVLCFLLITCVPQLFNNFEEPFIHPDYAANSLAPYFLDTNVQQYVAVSSFEYRETSAAISETSCHRVGLANWVFVEYPLWVGLKDVGWQGEIQNVNVQNVTRQFENPAFHPCISLSQESEGYVGIDANKVHLQLGTLALSIDPQVAGSLRWNVRGFHSSVSSVGILPGSGWSLAQKSGQPTLVQSGSIFLFSSVRQPIRLQVQSSSTRASAQLEVEATSAGLTPTVVSSAASLSMVVPPGITEIGVSPGQINLPGSPKVVGIEVGPAPTT